MKADIEKLRRMIQEAPSIVFFGGAGVSTESGIPDFRSQDGLYRQKWRDPPETILSHSYFLRHTDRFFDFYRAKILYPGAAPNAAHIALAKLEKAGKLKAVITQNIDGLHQKAGSIHVLELHGSVQRNHCMDCGRSYELKDVESAQGIPYCACGGIIKPDVVLYEEALDEEVIASSLSAIENASMLIIGGTSLTVYPAAAFVRYFRGSHLVIINRSPTPMDQNADLVISGSIGEALSQAVADL